MNNLSKNKLLLALSLALSTLTACTALGVNQTENTELDSKLSTDQVRYISSDDALAKYEDKVTYPLEGFCLYQTPTGQEHVFLLDESAIAHQMLIEHQGNNFSLSEIRRFPLPPKAEYCATDPVTEQLFISEENIGIWAYSARAESEVSRNVVDLKKPYGNVIHASGPLVVIDQQLLAAEKDGNVIHHYDIKKSATVLNTSYILSEKVKLDGLSVDKQGDDLFISYLDDTSEQSYFIKVAATESDANVNASKNMGHAIVNITADAETQPVQDQGDAADDPAIWLHPDSADKSLILGTNKQRGLLVYDLEGKQVQQLLVGRVNNVDVRQGFTHKGMPADIAAGSQRDNRSIALFHIDASNGEVSAVNEIVTGLDDVYGLCMYRGLEQKMYVFINDQDGRYEQYEINDTVAGWSGTRVREFSVDSQPEGCTADDKNQRLFVGEENVAVWTLGAEPDAKTEMTKVAEIGDVLKADIEGMELYQTEKENILLVSSQGNDSYVLFQADAPYEYLGRFRIVLNTESGVDGASETDGLTVSSAYLGDKYPQGLVVVQDGRNLLPDNNQNYKIVSWQKIDQQVLQLNKSKVSQ
jgi:3-phytase